MRFETTRTIRESVVTAAVVAQAAPTNENGGMRRKYRPTAIPAPITARGGNSRIRFVTFMPTAKRV